MRRAIAAILVAAVIPLGAARCATGGNDSPLPVKYQYAWMDEISPQQYYVVFQRGKPPGNWHLRGYVRGQTGVGVWVQRRQP